MNFQEGLDYAEQLDRADSLAAWRSEFMINDPDLIYMDGNSLGRLPHATAARMRCVVEEEWGVDLITSWGKGWYDAPQRVGDRLGELIGAGPGQVLVGDSTTVNLFKLVMAALVLRTQRSRILSDELNFPTDLYTIQGCVRLMGGRHQLALLPAGSDSQADAAAILDAIDDQTALVAFSHPTFKSGTLYDIPAITARAHQEGALVLWDLSHSAGVIPLELDEWGVDLAVGCTYKYLNGGPGAPAFLYVRRDLQPDIQPSLFGWWGHRAPFAFDLEYAATDSIKRLLVGTPPMLSLSAIEPSLEIIHKAGIPAIRQKSMQLTEYLVSLFDARLQPLGFCLGSPRQAGQRGSHVSIRHPEGYRICRAMIEEMKVIPDFREPDNIRLGLAPLYTRFVDVWQGVERIRRVMIEKRYAHFSAQRLEVT
jgi:kynureninase